MKKTTIIASILSFVGAVSCRPTPINKEDSALYDELCITDKSKFAPPIKLENLNNVEGIIFEKKGVYSNYYIKANDRFYSSCKLPNELKLNGLKIQFSGTTYDILYIPSQGAGNPLKESISLIISTIKIQ